MSVSEEHVGARERRPLAAPERRPEPAFSPELVTVCTGAIVVAPLIVVFTGSFLLFVLAGGLLAASVVVVLAAAIEETTDGDDHAGIAALPAPLIVAVMIASVVGAKAAGGGHWWALPSLLIPASAGWLALQSGIAHDVPDPTRRAPATDRTLAALDENLGVAYVALVVVVMLPLMAWFLGVV